jgi:hypothetical protein
MLQITPSGSEQLERLLAEWQEFTAAVRRLIAQEGES